METRTVPERVLVPVDVNMITLDRAASAVAGVAFAALAFSLLRRSFTGHSRLYAEKLTSLTTSTPVAVPHQSSITIQGSLEEIEAYLLEEAPPSVTLTYTARTPGSQIEVRAQSPSQGDRDLRALLRRAKQMIETGEIARSDLRVRGGDS